ncbi:MAG: hypothetical protein ABI846_01780 [Rudaea sp.]
MRVFERQLDGISVSNFAKFSRVVKPPDKVDSAPVLTGDDYARRLLDTAAFNTLSIF